MNKIILALALTLSSHAFGDENRPAWVGFKPIADMAIKEPVRLAGDSIFEMWQPFGEPEIKDVSDVDIKTMRTDGDEFFKVIQVRVCQLQNLKRCPIMPHSYAGTAFLLHDQQTLATDLHNIHAWLYHAKKNNPEVRLEDIQLPLLFVDKEQKIIFLPVTPGRSVTLKYFNRYTKPLFEQEYPWEMSAVSVYFRLSEYVELHLSEPIARTPLVVGSLAGESLFMAGYPKATDTFAKHGGLDAPGGELVVSTGQIQNSTMSVNWSTNIAAAPVASGSPLLNGEGKVVGILTAGDVSEVDGKLRVSSQFLQINKNLLDSVWRSLQP